MSELGLGVAALLAVPAGAGLLPEADRAEELEIAAFPEAASPPATALELGRTAWLGTHGAWGAGDAKQVEAVVAATLVDVATAASGWPCPCVDAA
jgi:hypothetical protein